MQTFNAMQYLAIDIANQAGLDKAPWNERIEWVKTHFNELESLIPEDPKTKFLYIKAVDTLRSINQPTGFVMALDASNSGVQIMAALGKCATSARTCNLINTGKREDLYGNILSQVGTSGITRQQVKDAIIPMLYGSKAAPKQLFGEGKQLQAFVYAVEKTVPILGEMKALMDSCWDIHKKYHQFTMPDGHVVRLPTMVLHHERIEIADTSFTYQWKDVGISEDSTSLLANVIHATDAYVTREMVRRCDFQLAHIHDSYWCHPMYMNQVRQTYVDILVDIAESDLLVNIMSEITGKPVTLNFTDPDLYLSIKDAEYALS
jgi:hypothetical protein